MPVFDKFKNKVGFTLDNEIFNHPDAVEILEYVENNCKDNYFHHGSTTGIAFLNHPKQAELLDVLKRNDWNYVSFAIHGNNETHNQIVKNDEGLESIIKACEIFKKNDFEIWISLMITKKLIEELSDISIILNQTKYDHILPVIPDYFPTTRLNKYQEIRCNTNDYKSLINFLEERNVDVTDVNNAIDSFNEQEIINNLNVESVKEKLLSKNMAFFHIDHNLNFYYGNTGSKLKSLGNIKELSSDDIYKTIIDSNDNYFETSTIHYDDIIEAINHNELNPSKENYVYPSEIAGLIAMINNYLRNSQGEKQ